MQNKTIPRYNGPLKTLDELPEKYRSLFSSYPSFNAIQSEVFHNVIKSNKSVVIAAPTGSGKTAVLELAIVKLLMDVENQGINYDFKMVYVCPVKALCTERFNDWNPRFNKLGVSCVEVTGDHGDYYDLQGYNLIITTPEKWDSLTRKWRDNAGLVQMVKLFMIDEVHLLSDNKRGPVLEAIVCRMKTISNCLNIDGVRFIAISATVYNIEDLAVWLGFKDSPAHCHKFGNEVRPVYLKKIVKGYSVPEKQNAFLFDIQLSYKLKSLILEHSEGKPTLVFCSTRKSVMMTSKVLSEQLSFRFTEIQTQNLRKFAAEISDGKLRELVMSGVAFHHAGMSTEDRHVVQNLFVAGQLPILVATSTLAMGVNLPAHLVIIKSTQQFNAGQVVEYPESSILQMIGRAGRPQFDTSATAIIMTQENKVAKYERLLDTKEILESSLHLHLPEYLNSEIVLHTITNSRIAMEWIRCTYLYVRALKNPRHYGFDPKADPGRIEKSLEIICQKEINGLKKAGLIESKNGIDISPTANGRLMSYFYLSFESFKIFLEIKGTESIPEILQALAEAHEFSEMQLRVNERKTLNELNRNKNRETIRFPLKGKIKTRALKINVLIQALLGCLPIQDPGLNQESHRIVRIAERLAKCLTEYLSKKPFYQSILSTVILAKCFHSKLWEDSQFVCRQLERIGPALCSSLTSCGKNSFDAIENSNPRDLERIVNRAPPFGNVLQDTVNHLPKYNLYVEKHGKQILIVVSLRNAEKLQEKNAAGNNHTSILLVGDTDNNLLYFTKLTDQLLCQKNFQVYVTQKGLPNKIEINLISETWVGFDLREEIEIVPVEKEPEKTPAKRKRKATACQATKTPKKKKVLEYLEEYAYKPKEIKNFSVENSPAPEIKKLETKVKIPFKPCFDVDIEIPEEDLYEEEESAPEEEVKASLTVKPFENITSSSFDVDFEIPEEALEEQEASISKKEVKVFSTSKPFENITSSGFNVDLDFPLLGLKIEEDEKPVSHVIKPQIKVPTLKRSFANPDRSLMRFEEELYSAPNIKKLDFGNLDRSFMHFEEYSNSAQNIKELDFEDPGRSFMRFREHSNFAPKIKKLDFGNPGRSLMHFEECSNSTLKIEKLEFGDSDRSLMHSEEYSNSALKIRKLDFGDPGRSLMHSEKLSNSALKIKIRDFGNPDKSYKQFEEDFNSTPEIKKPDFEDKKENLNQLNLTPKTEKAEVVKEPRTPALVSLLNIYERLKQTPRSNNRNSSRVSMSDSGYFSNP